ncbi:ParB/RepB/Spo0J family partition protein [Amaricoccus sp. W119]|uniref:ParB/RepB/Spo0J family partition protein n=1 Tax=Amaricoccus sp. W119 TaxID=3391833 RepID=UPI0039A59AFF
MRKRRVFDLDMPEEPAVAAVAASTFPAGKVALDESDDPGGARRRRGPMATAVQENADALRARAEAEAAIRAENDALAGELVRLKGLGLVVDLIPIDAIDTTKLSRDRIAGEDPELGELKTSIREIGLSNPIRVEPAGQGRYELVQGMRRLTAYRELLAETGDERYAKVPAGLMTDAEGLDQLYRRMVDENMVRKDISFMEMATMARDYARDPRTDCDDADKAVAILFQSAGYQKRSYIRAFVSLVDLLGEALRFPRELPRGLGLDLRRRLEAEPEALAAIREELGALAEPSADAELAVLRRWAAETQTPETFPAGKIPREGPRAGRKPKVTFDVARPGGAAKCTAANGRLEIRVPLDFSTMDRRRLEAAVRRMLDEVK